MQLKSKLNKKGGMILYKKISWPVIISGIC